MTSRARLGVTCATVGSFLWAVGGYVLCFIWLQVPSQESDQNAKAEWAQALGNTALKAGGIGVAMGFVIGIITWKVFISRPQKAHRATKPENRNRMFGLAPITPAEAFVPYYVYVPTAFAALIAFWHVLPRLDDSGVLALKPPSFTLLFALFIEAGIVTVPILPISIAINSGIFKWDRTITHEKSAHAIDTVDREIPGLSKSEINRFLCKHAFVYTMKNILITLFFSLMGVSLFLLGCHLFLACKNGKGGLGVPCSFFLAIAMVPWGVIFAVFGIAASFYVLKYLLIRATPGKTPEATAKRYVVGVIASPGFLLSPPYHQAWVLLLPSVAKKYRSFDLFRSHWQSFSGRHRETNTKPSWKVGIETQVDTIQHARAKVKLTPKKSSVGTVYISLGLRKVGRYWYVSDDGTTHPVASLKQSHNQ